MGARAATTTSRTGMPISERTRAGHGFTLVELIVVMALLAVVTAFAAPSLSRSLRYRHLNEEAVRFVALTEYARDEAISQGLPMVVWIDPAARHIGAQPKAEFVGAQSRDREFALNPDIHIELEQAITVRGLVYAAEFAPDGAPAFSNAAVIRLIDRFGSVITITQTSDGWGYEILKEKK